jgi:transcriptional regulator with XRE-family HTH domain
VSTAHITAIRKTPLTIAVAMPRKKYPETSFGERLQSIRKARGLTQVQLAEAAGTTQRAISYYETEAGFPPAPAVIDLARALQVTTDELLGVKTPKAGPVRQEDPEARKQWKRFQMIATLPERDQKAVVRLIHSLVAAGSIRRNGAQGERNGR